MNRYDAISGAVILLISIAIAAFSLTYPLGRLSQPGPGFLPFWCGIIMAGLSAVLIAQALLEKRKREHEEEKKAFFTKRWTKVVLAVAAIFAYTSLLELAGFFAANFIVILSLMKVIESEKWGIAVLEATIGAAGMYLLFDVWLKLNVPKGAWVEFLFK